MSLEVVYALGLLAAVCLVVGGFIVGYELGLRDGRAHGHVTVTTRHQECVRMMIVPEGLEVDVVPMTDEEWELEGGRL